MFKKVLKEPFYILYDIIYFFTNVKKPISFLFNFIISYQSIRVYFDKYLTKIYQKKFIELESSNKKKEELLKIQDDGVLKIENFYNFENPEKIINLLNEKEKNIEKLNNIVSQNREKIVKKLIYYLSFMRGENFDNDQIITTFEVHKDKNINDDFHSDVWSHSPKAYIYLNDINLEERPFIYLLKSHRDYKTRINLEVLAGKKLYLEKNKYKHTSSRLKENDDWEKYFIEFNKFIGIAKSGDVILADTSGFHAKGAGKNPRYSFWVETSRDNILNKLISILFIKKYFFKITN